MEAFFSMKNIMQGGVLFNFPFDISGYASPKISLSR